jgi:uncharacterized membrane protein
VCALILVNLHSRLSAQTQPVSYLSVNISLFMNNHCVIYQSVINFYILFISHSTTVVCHPNIQEIQNQWPQVLQLQDLMNHIQLMNINHNQLALLKISKTFWLYFEWGRDVLKTFHQKVTIILWYYSLI